MSAMLATSFDCVLCPLPLSTAAHPPQRLSLHKHIHSYSHHLLVACVLLPLLAAACVKVQVLCVAHLALVIRHQHTKRQGGGRETGEQRNRAHTTTSCIGPGMRECQGLQLPVLLLLLASCSQVDCRCSAHNQPRNTPTANHEPAASCVCLMPGPSTPQAAATHGPWYVFLHDPAPEGSGLQQSVGRGERSVWVTARHRATTASL